MKPESSGYIPFKGFKTYYEAYGPADNPQAAQVAQASDIPLLVLHGGPGSAHNYVLGLAKLATAGRRVIFYDQLGCGESDRPDDDFAWTVGLFLDELKTVREFLRLERIHLLGQSWGGMLAIEYMMTQPKGIQSLTLASSMISLPLYQQEVDKLKRDLPGGAAMFRHEAAGTTDSEEYQRALRTYSVNHLFRGGEFPKEYRVADEKEGTAAYRALWGPNEAFINGSLKDWDRIDDLATIKVPTLITSGQYDELTPWQAAITRNQIPDSELRIFTNGSHCVHVELEDEYLAVLGEFLGRHD